MKRLSILFLIDGLGGGGAEKVVLTLADAMSVEGHDVAIISLRDEQVYPAPDGVDLMLVEDRYRGPFHRQTEIRRRARQLDRLLKPYFSQRAFDLIISNLAKTDRIVAASEYLQKAWMCLHGAVASVELQRKRGIVRWFKRKQLQQTYNGRRLITVSNGLQQDLTECGGVRPARMVAIPNPFDLALIRRLSHGSCPLQGERFLIHVGRFRREKRHDRLLEAFRLSGYPGNLVLLGVGTKEENKELYRLCRRFGIDERVLFFEFTVNPYPYLRAAEALVVSSDYEGFGNVLVEALACGTTVVSTDCPYGPRDILTGDLARGLCDLSAESLAARLNDVLACPPRVVPGQLDRFSIKNVVARYLDLADSE